MNKKTNGRGPLLASRNPLTREQFATLADGLAFSLDYDGAEVARLLLLIHSLAYEPDATARENMLIDAEAKLASYVPGYDAAAFKAMRRELDALRKKGDA